MKKQVKLQPTDGELEILNVLWENGPSTVRFVNDTLSDSKEVGYTTTLKILQIMYEKGLVSRERQGKSHLYEAKISKESSRSNAVDKFLTNVFEGSAQSLVLHLLGSGRSSQKELEEIRSALNSIEESKNE